ncbi:MULTISPECIES: orotidine-5'-phosphate decarboxylase [Prosthecochloris]|uniref:Orotidine-5'-phosphate decarboxylase n=1 Tax=Prosthecochloris vibrioformis TaxID=1098 RepID=A0A5C4RZF4_PROVB|nr:MULTISPECIES: orotidine-5'-phosphate decarboxylase [Prosthecochloris]ANT63901.1 orotidine 5'-phosphate decarboxylase [Prosthecochloris sp. CIB 2401]TNJ36510.1 orotidine-5'-phosphate decarboxylase [Prosthecochloris vibrioformis]
MCFARQKVDALIRSRKSVLCVGLDSDLSKMPELFRAMDRPVLEFNRAVIRATSPYAVAYKINTAFYEADGLGGLRDMEDTLTLLPPETLSIADAKRADIGNTSRKYAQAFFEHWNFDAVTVAPYMGEDSLEPFFSYEDKLVFVLCLTSNQGSLDFEELLLEDGRPLYMAVLDKVRTWSRNCNAGVVVGATKTERLGEIRRSAPELCFLIPGVGAQGGSLEGALQSGLDTAGAGALVNVSRGIIYPEGSFASVAEYEAAVALKVHALHEEMRSVL